MPTSCELFLTNYVSQRVHSLNATHAITLDVCANQERKKRCNAKCLHKLLVIMRLIRLDLFPTLSTERLPDSGFNLTLDL